MTRNKLKQRRKALSLTQDEVAKEAGISRTYYTEIENGNRYCTVKIWLRIGEVLKISENELMSYIKEGVKKGA